MARRWPRWACGAAYALALLACGLVFLSYLRPELVIDLGNRLGSCF